MIKILVIDTMDSKNTNQETDSSLEVRVTEHVTFTWRHAFIGLAVLVIFGVFASAVLLISGDNYSFGEVDPSSDFDLVDGDGIVIPSEDLVAQFVTSSLNTDVLLVNQDESIGYYLSDNNNYTLYRLRAEEVCDESCGTLMLPYVTDTEYVAEDEFSRLSTRSLDDGSFHYYWIDKGLYLYAEDVEPGDILGDGINNKWELVRP